VAWVVEGDAGVVVVGLGATVVVGWTVVVVVATGAVVVTAAVVVVVWIGAWVVVGAPAGSSGLAVVVPQATRAIVASTVNVRLIGLPSRLMSALRRR
jgi:hypothetical protein